jgi:hypothetical protein
MVKQIKEIKAKSHRFSVLLPASSPVSSRCPGPHRDNHYPLIRRLLPTFGAVPSTPGY